MDTFLSIIPSRTFDICPKCYANKISSKRAGKTCLVKIEKKILLKTIGIL